MKFRIKSLGGAVAHIRHNCRTASFVCAKQLNFGPHVSIEVDVVMTKDQIFDAILEFQTQLTGAEWQEFLDLT